jgi:hypothetical protein
MKYTLWLFNIAMENDGHVFLAKTSNKTSIFIYGQFIPWLFGIKSGGAGP